MLVAQVDRASLAVGISDLAGALIVEHHEAVDLSEGPDAILERLTRLHPKLIDLGLDRIERLLEQLGSPHRKLPPIVHVAGTNGKGSLVAYLRAMTEAAGYRVHVYTSPHLVRFNERIRIAGRLIEDNELGELLTECEEANGEEPIELSELPNPTRNADTLPALAPP